MQKNLDAEAQIHEWAQTTKWIAHAFFLCTIVSSLQIIIRHGVPERRGLAMANRDNQNGPKCLMEGPVEKQKELHSLYMHIGKIM